MRGYQMGGWLALVVTAGGCASTVVVADGGPPGDASVDRSTLVDNPTPGDAACSTEPAIDLASVGARDGVVTRYSGNTGATPEAGPRAAPSGCQTGAVGHEQELRYTTRGAGRLRISTANPGTAINTVVWAFLDCGAAATSLGCNDNNPAGLTPASASVLFTPPLAANTAVRIVVGGIRGYPGGAFSLTVSEVAEVPAGGACDPAQLTNACAAGASCVGSGSSARCVADGAMRGACRASTEALRCDAGLGCSANERCVPLVAPGAACDPAALADVCGASASCRGSGAAARCVLDGALDGACRLEEGVAPCDAELACVTGRCVPGTPVGGACGAGIAPCVTGSGCLMARCVADGAVGAACRRTGGAPLCDPGLACVGGRCDRSLPDGEPCDRAGLLNACTAPSSCQSTADGRSLCVPSPFTETRLERPSFIDACASGAHVALNRDGVARHRLSAASAQRIPFEFSFAGATFTAIWPVTSGYAVLGPSEPLNVRGSFGPLPDLSERAMLAPFLADLSLRPAPTSDICVLATGAAPNRHLAIEWLDAFYTPLPASTHLTFELVLNEGENSVDFIYQRLDPSTGPDASRVDGSNASVGLQTGFGERYIRHVGAVETTSGVRFAPR